MELKKGIRILALTGAPFESKDRKELIVGLIGREGVVEGALTFKVGIDGLDSTGNLIKAVKRSRFSDQIKLVALNGITIAGFNLIDVEEVEKELGMPVIAITRRKPHRRMMRNALRYSMHKKEKVRVFDRIYSIMRIARINGYYVQSHGIEREEIESFLGTSVELLRLSHLIASALERGESKGRI